MAMIRPGAFGDTQDVFDNYGNKVATIRPGAFGDTQDIFDTNGNKLATIRPGAYGSHQDIFDLIGNKISTVRPGAFGHSGYISTTTATKRRRTGQATMEMGINPGIALRYSSGSLIRRPLTLCAALILP